MWHLLTLPSGEKVVSTDLSETMSLTLLRARDAAVFVNITSDDKETRLFDKARLPILTIDGNHAIDMSDGLSLQNLPGMDIVMCFAEHHSVGSRIWNGEEIGPDASILKMMLGKNLHIRISSILSQ